MRCLNCGAEMTGGSCSYCGDKAVKKNINLGSNYSNNNSSNNNGPIRISALKKIVRLIILIVIFIVIKNVIFNKPNNNTSNNESKSNNEVVVDDVKSKIDEDDSIEEPDVNGEFLMPIEDVFSITGRGTVVTGRIESGTLKKGDMIRVIGLNHEEIKTKVVSIEKFRKEMDEAVAGDNVGVLLENVERDDVERGQVLTTDGSLNVHSDFDAKIYFYTKDEGGRSSDILDNYEIQFFFRGTDITGVLDLTDVSKASPGDNNVKVNVKLKSNVAMKEGDSFIIREGGRSIAKGYITKLND